MTPRSIAITLLILCAGALVVAATALLVREKTPAPIQVLVPEGDAGPGPSPVAPQPGPAQIQVLRVHIAGAVRRPGVYLLRPEDRLVDALELAGGPTEEADLDTVNLAQSLRDAERYYIPHLGEAAPPLPGAPPPVSPEESSAMSPPDAPRVDLNAATAAILDALPGIGPAKARAIVEHRGRHGPFDSPEELMEVSGIGPTIYAGIQDLVTVGP